MWPLLDERTRRLMAASEALGVAHGGCPSCTARADCREGPLRGAFGEIRSGAVLEAGRIRRRGAGRKPITVHDPHLLVALDG